MSRLMCISQSNTKRYYVQYFKVKSIKMIKSIIALKKKIGHRQAEQKTSK